MPGMPNIGMSVPGASGLMSPTSTEAETEQQKKKRLQSIMSQQQMPGVSALGLNYGAALGG